MLYIECDADKTLVIALLTTSSETIEHSFGKGNVCNKLKVKTVSKGLVDEDPLSPQPSYMNTLKLISEKQNIKLLYDEKNKSYLIVLQPRLEEWILGVTRSENIDITKYFLPNDAKSLHSVLMRKKGRENFKNLLKDIQSKSEAIKTLGNFISCNF